MADTFPILAAYDAVCAAIETIVDEANGPIHELLRAPVGPDSSAGKTTVGLIIERATRRGGTPGCRTWEVVLGFTANVKTNKQDTAPEYTAVKIFGAMMTAIDEAEALGAAEGGLAPAVVNFPTYDLWYHANNSADFHFVGFTGTLNLTVQDPLKQTT